MVLETGELDRPCPSPQHPADQRPLQHSSSKDGSSDVEEETSGGGGKVLSSKPSESHILRQEPKTHEQENSKEMELKIRTSCCRTSGSEGSSNAENSRKRSIRSRHSPRRRTGSSGDSEHSVTLGRKKTKAPDTGDCSEPEETRDARHRGPSGARTGRSKRSRAWSPEDEPPPLRKSLVSSLRSLSEDIYQDLVQLQAQQAYSPLTWEQLSWLAQLRGPLCARAQDVLTMATQAAYAFPAQGWLAPAPPPGARDPARDGEAAQASAEGQGPHPFPGEEEAGDISESEQA